MPETHHDSPQRPSTAGSLAAAPEFAGLLDAGFTEQDRLRLTASLAAELLECGAALRLCARDGASSLAASEASVQDAERRQVELGEGPSLDALANATTVVANDVTADVRWPDWAPAARDLGVLAVVAVPLTHGKPAGVLTLYAQTAGRFDAESLEVVSALAAHLGIALATSRELEHQRLALEHRTIIGQAVGILMERFKLPPDEAFAMLREASQRTNHKLRDIADRLTTTGELP